MTKTIDKFLIGHGVNEIDLKGTKSRSWLYAGILAEAAFALVFTALAVTAWT